MPGADLRPGCHPALPSTKKNPPVGSAATSSPRNSQLLPCPLLDARQRMPTALHAISDALSLSYAVDGIHHLTGQGGAVAADIAIVAAYAFGALVLGAATLRRRTN